jgi:CheY-like chemotaxis protein
VFNFKQSVFKTTQVAPVILTVEDEFFVGEGLRHVLASAGHEVISTADADEAIEVLESRNDIGIVITDINMPGSMDGLKLAGAIRGRWPPIKIIITSGAGRPSDELMPARSQFVGKPHVPQEVLAAVRRAELGWWCSADFPFAKWPRAEWSERSVNFGSSNLMTQDDKAVRQNKLAARFKEAIRQSIAEAWVKERYAPPVETPELDALVARMDEQGDTKA